MAVGCSRSVQWEGIDKKATWDFQAKPQSTPLVSSSLIRPDRALEEQKPNAGNKSMWKEAKTGLVHITSKPQECWISPWTWEPGSGLGSLQAAHGWGCLDNTVYPLCPARCWGISGGTNGWIVGQRRAECSTHSSHTSLPPRQPWPLFV